MNNSLKNIPIEFLKNDKTKSSNKDFYIKSNTKVASSNKDTIWIIIIFLIILDIV